MQGESNNASRHHTHSAMAATDSLPLVAVRSATVVKVSSDRGMGEGREVEGDEEWVGGAVVMVKWRWVEVVVVVVVGARRGGEEAESLHKAAP